MSDIGNTEDLTVQLPDELLSHVLSFLSLSDKLRSESVNRKFQRCMIAELSANPQPLELDLNDETLNGHRVPLSQLFGAVEALAKRAKFSSVCFGYCGTMVVAAAVERMDSILSLLISRSQCLSKVTRFKSISGCSQEMLGNFLDKCAKLSRLELICEVRPLNSQPDMANVAFPLYLGQLFKDKPFIELTLSPTFHRQTDLVLIFQAIEPNMLNKLVLLFKRHILVSMVELVDALSPVGSTLQELRLDFDAIGIELADLFQVLPRLPALRKCEISCFFIHGIIEQFVPIVTSLFFNSAINIKIYADGFSYFLDFRGCQTVNMIRQIQNVHPSLVVDFDHQYVYLTLGNASIRTYFPIRMHCGAENCVECQSFYPCILMFLRFRANDFIAAQHLNWQLDRCRVDKIVDDLNLKPDTAGWTALSVEVGEDQQRVAIKFETKMMEPNRFSITVGCRRCLTNGCMECMD